MKNILLISAVVRNKNGDNKSQIVTYKLEILQNDKQEQNCKRQLDEIRSQPSSYNTIISLRHSSDRGQPQYFQRTYPTLIFTDGERVFRDDKTILVLPEDRNRKADDPLRSRISISRICGLTMSENQMSYLVGGVLQFNAIHNTQQLFFKLDGEDKDIVILLKQERVVDIQICQCRMCDGEQSLSSDISVKNYQKNYVQ